MKLYIELPMLVLKEYQGTAGVYQVLDDHITDQVRKPFEDRGIDAKIVKIDFVDPIPNVNDELVRYELEAAVDEKEFSPAWIRQPLEEEGYDKGLTIKDLHGDSLYHDAFTPDIPLRRKTQVK